jgi:hypothetical protein
VVRQHQLPGRVQSLVAPQPILLGFSPPGGCAEDLIAHQGDLGFDLLARPLEEPFRNHNLPGHRPVPGDRADGVAVTAAGPRWTTGVRSVRSTRARAPRTAACGSVPAAMSAPWLPWLSAEST